MSLPPVPNPFTTSCTNDCSPFINEKKRYVLRIYSVKSTIITSCKIIIINYPSNTHAVSKCFRFCPKFRHEIVPVFSLRVHKLYRICSNLAAQFIYWYLQYYMGEVNKLLQQNLYSICACNGKIL
jgi:hypothetical protein